MTAILLSLKVAVSSESRELYYSAILYFVLSLVAVVFVKVFIVTPHKIIKDIDGKYEKELERNRPKFKLSCNKDTQGRALYAPGGKVAFFRIKVETDCVNGVKNCVGNLLKIEKDGVVVFDHDTLKLPFAKAEDPKSLEKTVAQDTPEWLDVLAIYLYQPPPFSEVETLVRAYNPHALPKIDDRDAIAIATKPHSHARDINGNYIFKKAGEYVLHITVIGDIAPTAKAKLKLSWTGYAKDSTIEIV